MGHTVNAVSLCSCNGVTLPDLLPSVITSAVLDSVAQCPNFSTPLTRRGILIPAVWKRNPALGLVLGVAMPGNMIIAGTVGAGVPLFLRRVGVDPAVASAIVVTTFTDVFGFLLFLGIATAALNLLV